MKTLVIVQSSYIPWKGFFDLVNLADEVVLLDDVQFTKRDWRNRNRIKTPHGPRWLTIPVEVKGRYHQTIRETRIAESGWSQRHLKTLRHNYAHAPHYSRYEPALKRLYGRVASETALSEVNRTLIEGIAALLDISTRLSSSADFELSEGPTERLVSICRQAGARRYLSGPSASAYLDVTLFDRAGIDIAYMDYSGYPEYPQSYPPFDHHVTVLDLLVHTGPEAPRYMKSF